MSWSIPIPHYDRSDPVAEVGFAARHLEDKEEVAIARQLAVDAMLVGHQTAGDLIDDIERRSAVERRTVLDKARKGAGLPSTSEVEAERRAEDARPTVRGR